MGYTKSFYHGYGIRISLPDGWHQEHDESLEEFLGFDTPVRAMTAGDYDANWNWLFIQDSTPEGPEVKLGQYQKVDPYAADPDKLLWWDWWLTETARKHGLKITDGPAWFFIPDLA